MATTHEISLVLKQNGISETAGLLDSLTGALNRTGKASDAAFAKLNKLEKIEHHLTDLSKGFKSVQSAAEGFLGVLTSAAAGWQFGKMVLELNKNLYDLSRISKVTGQDFGDMKKGIDGIVSSTRLSTVEATRFYKTLSDGVVGIRLNAEAAKALAKTLSDEFGPSLEDVQGGLKDLLSIQAKEVHALERLRENMDPAELDRYAKSLYLVHGASRKEVEVFLRAANAHRDGARALTKEEQQLREYAEATQALSKSFQEITAKYGKELAGTFTTIANTVAELITKAGDLAKQPWFPAVAKMVAGGAVAFGGIKAASTVVNSATSLVAGGRDASGERKGGLLGILGMKSSPAHVIVDNMMPGVGGGSGLGGAAGGGAWHGGGMKGLLVRGGVGLAGMAAAQAADWGGQKLQQSGNIRAGAGVSTAGKVAGYATTGAMLGSILPGIGTGLGAIAGAAYGLYESLDDIETVMTGTTKASRDAKKALDDATAAEAKLASERAAGTEKEKKSAGPAVDTGMDLAKIEKARAQVAQMDKLMDNFAQRNEAAANIAEKYTDNLKEALSLRSEMVGFADQELKQAEMLLKTVKARGPLASAEKKSLSDIVASLKAKNLSEEEYQDALVKEVALHGTLADLEKNVSDKINKKKQAELDLTKVFDSRIKVANQETALLEAQADLVKAQYLGLGPTLDTQMAIVESIENQIDLLRNVEAINKKLSDESGGKNLEAVSKYKQAQMDILGLQKKQLDVTKNLREGYLDAIQAFSNVEGAFGKIILSKDLGVAEMQRQFGSAGGLRAGKVGAGGEAPVMGWKPGGGLNFDKNWKERARKYDADIDMPEKLRLNRAAAEQDSGAGDYLRQKDASRQTGLTEVGQKTTELAGKQVDVLQSLNENMAKYVEQGTRSANSDIDKKDQQAANRALVKNQTEAKAGVGKAAEEMESGDSISKQYAQDAEAAEKKVNDWVGYMNRTSNFMDGYSSVKTKSDKMAAGGIVGGSGSGDTIPAMLTPGEFVVNKKASQQHMGLLKALNNNKYSEGGEVLGFDLSGGALEGLGLTDGSKKRRNALTGMGSGTEFAGMSTMQTAERVQYNQSRPGWQRERQEALEAQAKARADRQAAAARSLVGGLPSSAITPSRSERGAIASKYATSEQPGSSVGLSRQDLEEWRNFKSKGEAESTVRGISNYVGGATQKQAAMSEKHLAEVSAKRLEAEKDAAESAGRIEVSKKTQLQWAENLVKAQEAEGKDSKRVADLTKKLEAERRYQNEEAGRLSEIQASITGLTEKEASAKRDFIEKKAIAKEAQKTLSAAHSAIGNFAEQEKRDQAKKAEEAARVQRLRATGEGPQQDLAMSATSKAFYANRGTAPMGKRAAAYKAMQDKMAAAGAAAATRGDQQDLAAGNKSAAAKAKHEAWMRDQFGGGYATGSKGKSGSKAEKEAERQTRAVEKTAAASQQTAKATTETNKEVTKGAKPSTASVAAGAAAEDYRTNPVVSTICGNLKMASGGRVPGTGSGDTVPAMLTPGEFVMNKKASQQHMELLSSLNTNKYAAGGVVMPSSMGGGGGGGGGLNIGLNVQGNSYAQIMQSVTKQLGNTLSKMMSPSGTSGRYHDLAQSG